MNRRPLNPIVRGVAVTLVCVAEMAWLAAREAAPVGARGAGDILAGAVMIVLAVAVFLDVRMSG